MFDLGKLKDGTPRVRKKSRYRVLNHSEYNQSLRKRGMLSLYFPKGDLEKLLVDVQPYKKGISGRGPTYLPAYVELIFIMYRLFNWGQRQITGFFEDHWRIRGINLPVPSFGNLSDLFAQLSPERLELCKRAVKKLKKRKAVNLIVDSTGLTFGKASDWHRVKYGINPVNRPWRKWHIAMDEDFNILGSNITNCNVPDINELDNIIPEDIDIESLLGDGGYYSKEQIEKLLELGIQPIIPPPKNAKVHDLEDTKYHDKIVKYIEKKGKYAYKNKFGYGARELVESQFSRVKRCIGDFLLTQRNESQKIESEIISSIINFWNSLGRPITEKI